MTVEKCGRVVWADKFFILNTETAEDYKQLAAQIGIQTGYCDFNMVLDGIDGNT